MNNISDNKTLYFTDKCYIFCFTPHKQSTTCHWWLPSLVGLGNSGATSEMCSKSFFYSKFIALLWSRILFSINNVCLCSMCTTQNSINNLWQLFLSTVLFYISIQNNVIILVPHKMSKKSHLWTGNRVTNWDTLYKSRPSEERKVLNDLLGSSNVRGNDYFRKLDDYLRARECNGNTWE